MAKIGDLWGDGDGSHPDYNSIPDIFTTTSTSKSFPLHKPKPILTVTDAKIITINSEESVTISTSASGVLLTFHKRGKKWGAVAEHSLFLSFEVWEELNSFLGSVRAMEKLKDMNRP